MPDLVVLLPYYAAMITFWTFWNLALAFVMVLAIAVISGYMGARKILKIDPMTFSEVSACVAE